MLYTSIFLILYVYTAYKYIYPILLLSPRQSFSQFVITFRFHGFLFSAATAATLRKLAHRCGREGKGEKERKKRELCQGSRLQFAYL